MAPIPMLDILERTGAYFIKESPIHQAARRLVKTLQEMRVPFAIAGALAANAHGHVRTTEDVDILITPEGLQAFKDSWLGRGWMEKFPGSKGLKDTLTQVNIDVLLTGEYPGDGRPKPIVFPDPEAASELDNDGIPILRLKNLIELKIASGTTAPDRPRDLDDVIQLIRANSLPQQYTATLNSYVQEKYDELWRAAQHRDEY